jgi:predicted DNA repair protein MutK
VAGLIGYIGALADDLSVVASKVAAGSLDDIANQTGKSLSKTAGILIDDTATIPQYVSNTAAKRELPVIWKITKKSLRNKALMIPVAILITYFAPWLMAPILVVGGSYLAFEGSESLGEKIGIIKEHEHPHEHSIAGTEDLRAAEDETVASAVRTDTILSIEIIALTIATVVDEAIATQIVVLVLIGLIATVGVYGIVGMIIKMDDVGFYLRDKHSKNRVLAFMGKLLILGMPKLMKAIGIIGMIAMLMVGGGILLHNLPFLHSVIHFGSSFPSIIPQIMELFATPVSVALIAGMLIMVVKHQLTNLLAKKKR